ncbi:hypothetical protein [Nocardia sp. NPDC050175]|uniref:hypothetical protein n=1 Tax=Nocardia sp. NPDC050175 TaxID=3364317 RepID=UPI0037BD8810
MINRTVPVPIGYQWTPRWDGSPGLFGILLGVLLVVLSLFGIGRIPMYFIIVMCSGGLILIAGSIRGGHLAAEVTEDVVAVRYQPWTSPIVLINGLAVLVGLEAAWGGFTGNAPEWFGPAGALVAVILVPMLVGHFTILRRNRILLTRRTLRIVQSGFDWEFKWSSISSVIPRTIPNLGPAVTVVCPTESTIDRSRGPRFLKRKDADGEWTILLQAFNVEPNALLSTLEFMVNNPRGHRRELTTADFIAMLTPPD